MTMLRLVLFMSGALLALADNPEVITVPEDVLKFIIGCRQAPIGGQYTVPVHKTDISDIDGTTSQHVSLLSLDELRESLSQTVHSEAVVGHILGQVEDAVKTDKLTKSRSNCLVDMQVNVPPQEIDDFNDRVQMLLQQNKFLLLEQINTLFTYKLRNLKDDIERLVKRRSNNIMNKLDKIMAHLGIPGDVNGDEGNDSDEYDTLDEVTTFQPISEPSSQTTLRPEPTSQPETTPQPTTAEPESAESGTDSQPEAEPESKPEPEPEPEPEPTTAADVAEATTLNPGSSDSSKPSSSSSEEDTAEDNGKDSAASDTFIRTSQQKPIASSSGIGILPSLTRTRNRDRLRPIYPGGLTFQERYKQSLEQRRQFYRRN